MTEPKEDTPPTGLDDETQEKLNRVKRISERLGLNWLSALAIDDASD